MKKNYEVVKTAKSLPSVKLNEGSMFALELYPPATHKLSWLQASPWASLRQTRLPNVSALMICFGFISNRDRAMNIVGDLLFHGANGKMNECRLGFAFISWQSRLLIVGIFLLLNHGRFYSQVTDIQLSPSAVRPHSQLTNPLNINPLDEICTGLNYIYSHFWRSEKTFWEASRSRLMISLWMFYGNRSDRLKCCINPSDSPHV